MFSQIKTLQLQLESASDDYVSKSKSYLLAIADAMRLQLKYLRESRSKAKQTSNWVASTGDRISAFAEQFQAVRKSTDNICGRIEAL